MNSNLLYPVPAKGSDGLPIQSQVLNVNSTGQQFAGYDAQRHVTCVTVEVRTNPVYVSFDGQTPSSTIGHSLPAGSMYTWSVGMFNEAKFSMNGSAAYLVASPLNV